jgi:hypothetical protein
MTLKSEVNSWSYTLHVACDHLTISHLNSNYKGHLSHILQKWGNIGIYE